MSVIVLIFTKAFFTHVGVVETGLTGVLGFLSVRPWFDLLLVVDVDVELVFTSALITIHPFVTCPLAIFDVPKIKDDWKHDY